LRSILSELRAGPFDHAIEGGSQLCIFYRRSDEGGLRNLEGRRHFLNLLGEHPHRNTVVPFYDAALRANLKLPIANFTAALNT
jgi:hypothetical protein